MKKLLLLLSIIQIINFSCSKFGIQKMHTSVLIEIPFGQGAGEAGAVFINGRWDGVSGVVEKGQQYMYIADNYNRRIMVFSKSGKHVKDISYEYDIKKVELLRESGKYLYIVVSDKSSVNIENNTIISRLFRYNIKKENLSLYSDLQFADLTGIFRRNDEEELIVFSMNNGDVLIGILKNGKQIVSLDSSELGIDKDREILFNHFSDYTGENIIFGTGIINDPSPSDMEITYYKFNIDSRNKNFLFKKRNSFGNFMSFSKFDHMIFWKGEKNETAIIKFLNMKGKTVVRRLINFNKIYNNILNLHISNNEIFYAVGITSKRYRILKIK